MDKDGEGVCADSQHENVLMGMELAAGAENQASELPIYRPARAVSRPEVCRKVGSSAPELAGSVLPFPASHRQSYLPPVVDGR
jgi:hypothetical protein